ncbi:MAG: Gfo/Idh/MocA family oxidoreductase [Planctomycetia bacterium]|nr:Gfo/Idh/MocA family oxidoreductase [Planctomycetia bacterium]
MNRREFLHRTSATGLGTGLGVTILSNPGSVKGTPANEKVNLAFLGCGGRGTYLAKGFLERDDVNIVACYDPNHDRAELFSKVPADKGQKTKVAKDMREVLDDKSVDAVVSATPDHWHALITVLSCQAGKDVYIEKPASHSAWEGWQMVQAARKYKRIVQHGTQNRSAAYNMKARKYIEEGKLGKVHFARIYNMKSWPNLPLSPECDPPAGFDWNTWSGPAPLHHYRQIYTRYWHHFWDYSSGDIINDAIHQIDLCRMLINKEFPKSVYCVGERFNSQGAAQTPDTQVATFEYDDMLVTFELTLYTPYMLKIDPEVRNNDMFPYWPQCATRIEIYGEKGVMIIGRHGGGWQVFERTKQREPVVTSQEYGRFPDPEHKENFIHCIRTRETPNADIEIGFRSVLLAQYATISNRLGGQKIVVDAKNNGAIVGCPEAAPYYKRTYRAPFVVPDQV